MGDIYFSVRRFGNIFELRTTYIRLRSGFEKIQGVRVNLKISLCDTTEICEKIVFAILLTTVQAYTYLRFIIVIS